MHGDKPPGAPIAESPQWLAHVRNLIDFVSVALRAIEGVRLGLQVPEVFKPRVPQVDGCIGSHDTEHSNGRDTLMPKIDWHKTERVLKTAGKVVGGLAVIAGAIKGH